MSKRSKKKPGGRSVSQAWREWNETKSPVWRFGAKFCVLTICFYAVSLAPFWHRPLSGFLAADARIAATLLNFFGQKTSLANTTLRSGSFAITVDSPCSALEFVWFIGAAVLAFPARGVDRLAGLLVSAAVIFMLNIARIMSLLFVGARFAAIFDAVHVEVWPSVLIVATVSMMAIWIRWTRRETRIEAV